MISFSSHHGFMGVKGCQRNCRSQSASWRVEMESAELDIFAEDINL
jgi:hypothetical protein